MIALFKRIVCALDGHGGVRFERIRRQRTKRDLRMQGGTRYTCKRCGSIWTEWDK